MSRVACLRTDRLTLVAATEAHIRTELERPGDLSALLDAYVSPTWPPGEYDRQAMQFFLACFEKDGRSAEGWYGWYALRANDQDDQRILVGAAGYFGPPTDDGQVEVGYSVLPEWRGRGYAAEMVRALVGRAFGISGINRVIARTTRENLASIKVLLKAGFHETGAATDSDVLLFARSRAMSA